MKNFHLFRTLRDKRESLLRKLNPDKVLHRRKVSKEAENFAVKVFQIEDMSIQEAKDDFQAK